jgi:hypothetical protein
MIIWSGLGVLVAVITFASLVLTAYATGALFGDASYYQTHGWPKLLAFLIAGAVVWWLGTSLNEKQGRVMIDKETGREVVIKPNHSLFFHQDGILGADPLGLGGPLLLLWARLTIYSAVA